jgi:hypothetical protein
VASVASVASVGSSTLTAMHLARRIGVALIRSKRVQFGRIHLFDVGASLVVDGVDSPHAIAGLTRGFRLALGPRVPRELVEDGRPGCPLTRRGEEPADSIERVAKTLARLAGDAIELFGIEPERPVAAHVWFLLTALHRFTAVMTVCLRVAK